MFFADLQVSKMNPAYEPEPKSDHVNLIMSTCPTPPRRERSPQPPSANWCKVPSVKTCFRLFCWILGVVVVFVFVSVLLVHFRAVYGNTKCKYIMKYYFTR